MSIRRLEILALAVFAAAACTVQAFDADLKPSVGEGSGVVVSLTAGPGSETRNRVSSDALGVEWTADDDLALWAYSGGAAALSAQRFEMFGLLGPQAVFTATLSSPMPEGEYSYYAVSPCPESVSGGKAWFSIPSSQDGKGSGVMQSSATVSAAELGTGELFLAMKQKLHLLKFWLPSEYASLLGGEPVSRIELTFTKAVAGRAGFDPSNPSSKAVLNTSGQSSEIVLNLDKPLAASASGARSYTFATVVPQEFGAGDRMSVKIFTDSKVAEAGVFDLTGRSFAEGHATPVRLSPSKVGEYRRIYIDYKGSNLGEEVNSIKLTAPSGCSWGDGAGSEWVYSPGGTIPAGTRLSFEFEDVSAYEAFSGAAVNFTFESEHVSIPLKAQFPSISGRKSVNVAIEAPWLLNESFSAVPTFSSNDEYSGGFVTGSKDPHSFLSGWTGARIGAQSGKCIRIACRRETSANYAARVDSAPLAGTLKKKASLRLEFDYGADNKYGGIAIFSNPDVGQTCFMGYVTNTKGYKSGDEDGTFADANSFYLKEYTGSYSSTPNHADYILPSVGAGGTIRVTIRTEPEYNAGTTNTTCWLYIDNVKVTISND
ncbi:MAG: hypothetical protein IJS66_05070 [Bacteroidales bacterium]|nr:hypothetical protein [Bacteroidales bacterium]